MAKKVKKRRQRKPLTKEEKQKKYNSRREQYFREKNKTKEFLEKNGSKGGHVSCLRCEKNFYSHCKKSIRICPICKEINKGYYVAPVCLTR